MNLPMWFTVLRIALVPLIVLSMLLLPGYWAALLFVCAALSDWLDGWLARRYAQVSRFGAFLDPVADKLVIISVLILLTAFHQTLWFSLPALCIVSREVLVLALREWMVEVGQRAPVSVSRLGKWKTTLQFVALLLFLLVGRGDELLLLLTAYLLLYVSLVLTLWSMVNYLRAAWSELDWKGERKH